MVGVPGRSKACRTCRRRKKGCDLEQPSCGQCRKACIPCEGYSTSLTIYQYDYDRKKGSGLSLQTKANTQSSLVLIPQNKVSPIKAASPVTAMDHVTFSHAALESAFEGIFWDSYLPNSRCSSLLDYNQRTLGGSISVVRELLPNSLLLRTALGAMALRSAASTDIDPHSWKQQAMRLHASALRQMRKMITTHRKNDLELLSATRVFSFYEALYGSDWADKGEHFRNWSVHHSGNLALMVSKPPSYYRTGAAHRLFVDGRVNLALHALTTRKGSVLLEPAWRNDPWEFHPKTVKDLLVDIILEVPSLFEGIGEMEKNQRFGSNSRQALQQAAYATLVRLLQWGERYGIQVISSQPDWKHPSGFTTEEIARVHLMTFYWATLIIAHNIYLTISNGEPHDLEIDADDCCRRIIHCIPLFLHPSTGIFRQHLMPFPAMAVIRHLNSIQSSLLGQEREYMLSISAASELAGMRKFMSSLQPQIFASDEDEAQSLGNRGFGD